MRNKVHLYVDASNFARMKTQTSLNWLFEVQSSLIELLDGREHHILFIADPGLHHLFTQSERRQFDLMIENQEVIQAQQGTKADPELLRLAKKHDGHVVTGDAFRDHPDYHDWVYQPGAARLIGGIRDPSDGQWLFSERYVRGNSLSRYSVRQFSQVLDDLYPTPRSVFRQLGLTADQVREFYSALELHGQETDIISQDEAERIRVTVRQLLEYRTPVASLIAKSRVSERDCLQWLSLNGLFALQRDDSHYVAEDVASEIQTWITSSFPTLLSFQLKRAIDDKDVAEIKRFINDLDFDGDVEMVAFARVCLAAFEAKPKLDWSHLEALSPSLIDHAMEHLSTKGSISQLAEAPNQTLAKLPSRYQALIHAERFIQTRAYDDLVSCLTIASQNISESETTVSKVAKVVLKEALNGSLDLPAKSWAVLGELFHASIHSTPVIDVCRYLAGQRFTAVANPVGRVTTVRSELRQRYLVEVLGVSWISSSELGGFLEHDDLRDFLSEDDVSSFFSSSQVVEFIEGKIDELEGDETEGAQVAFSALALKRLQPLLSVVHGAIEGMEAVRR
jgi:hypothetical protein